MVYLLDSNVLIALANTDHTAHALAVRWFARTKPKFATCPITQGALIRFYFRVVERPSLASAKRLLESFTAAKGHVFWPDSIPYADIEGRALIGHRQVTDAYLVSLAEANNGRLATMDAALLALYPGQCAAVA